MTRVQLTDSEGEFVDPYLPIGEYGPYPERLRQQFEGVIWRFKTGGRPWSVRGVEERTAAERRERERADLIEQDDPWGGMGEFTQEPPL
ncbi:hypothetical protein OHB41_47460 [Streptomyces sp. NBC_01571]|nr:hypothetical protein [Streptomyces sp. NBC_01571]MCX4580641.1 hypothetical protein [Streptomyces sp. NBC_01571]